MDDLLDALGVAGRLRRAATAVAIWIAFPVAMLGIAGAQAAAEYALGIGPAGSVAVVGAVWALWTAWHSVWFEAGRRRLLRRDRAYRRAFLRHIVPGITVGFSQMLRPVLNGPSLRDGAPSLPAGPSATVAAVAGCVLVVLATWLFLRAWAVLGAARVGFVPEFGDPGTFTPERRGPYGRVRHPLFWSGVAVSAGLALLHPGPAAIGIACLNAGYGLVYNGLEDRRLLRVFGARYGDYASAVARIVPARIVPRAPSPTVRPGPDGPRP